MPEKRKVILTPTEAGKLIELAMLGQGWVCSHVNFHTKPVKKVLPGKIEWSATLVNVSIDCERISDDEIACGNPGKIQDPNEYQGGPQK